MRSLDEPITEMELGDTIRHRRENAGVSRIDLATMVHGLTEPKVHAWEDGRNLAAVSAYFRALEAHGCKVEISQPQPGLCTPPLRIVRD